MKLPLQKGGMYYKKTHMVIVLAGFTTVVVWKIVAKKLVIATKEVLLQYMFAIAFLHFRVRYHK
jgi:hypothetical protein